MVKQKSGAKARSGTVNKSNVNVRLNRLGKAKSKVKNMSDDSIAMDLSQSHKDTFDLESDEFEIWQTDNASMDIEGVDTPLSPETKEEMLNRIDSQIEALKEYSKQHDNQYKKELEKIKEDIEANSINYTKKIKKSALTEKDLDILEQKLVNLKNELNSAYYTPIQNIPEFENEKNNWNKLVGSINAELAFIKAERKNSQSFNNDLKSIYDEINVSERRGGMVPIPPIWDNLYAKGYSREQFEKDLFDLEKQRVIDLQIASDHKVLKEPDKAIKHPTRGYINYIVWRRQSDSNIVQSQSQSQSAKKSKPRSQEQIIADELIKANIINDASEFDSSLIDPQLDTKQNTHSIKAMYESDKGRQDLRSISIPEDQAIDRFLSQSDRKIENDLKKTDPEVLPEANLKWYEQPGKSDVNGIDTSDMSREKLEKKKIALMSQTELKREANEIKQQINRLESESLNDSEVTELNNLKTIYFDIIENLE